MCHSTIERNKTLGRKTEEADGGDTILSETKIGPLFPLARQILTLPHTQVCITSYLCKRTRVQVGQLMLPSTAFKFKGTVDMKQMIANIAEQDPAC
jgi:hypothetical protein